MVYCREFLVQPQGEDSFLNVFTELEPVSNII